MGAEISWQNDKSIKRHGNIRMGADFNSSASFDPWTAIMSIQDLGHGYCYLFGIGGKVTLADIKASLQACLDAGFEFAIEHRRMLRTRINRLWLYELTLPTFPRRILWDD